MAVLEELEYEVLITIMNIQMAEMTEATIEYIFYYIFTVESKGISNNFDGIC